MKKFSLLVASAALSFFAAGLGFASDAPAAATAAPSTGATAPDPSSEPLIADPLHDPAWKDLFARLAPQRSRISQFEERRFFPFRKEPTLLTGEIRMIPGRGLSLHYLTPEPRIVIVDEQGVLLRDEHGRSRAAPADSRAQAVSHALFNILRFDTSALAQSFELRGHRDGSHWTLVFAPRDSAIADLIGRIVVTGTDARLEHISMQKSSTQHIDIALRDTRENVIFAGDVLDRYFR